MPKQTSPLKQNIFEFLDLNSEAFTKIDKLSKTESKYLELLTASSSDDTIKVSFPLPSIRDKSTNEPLSDRVRLFESVKSALRNGDITDTTELTEPLLECYKEFYDTNNRNARTCQQDLSALQVVAIQSNQLDFVKTVDTFLSETINVKAFSRGKLFLEEYYPIPGSGEKRIDETIAKFNQEEAPSFEDKTKLLRSIEKSQVFTHGVTLLEIALHMQMSYSNDDENASNYLKLVDWLLSDAKIASNLFLTYAEFSFAGSDSKHRKILDKILQMGSNELSELIAKHVESELQKLHDSQNDFSPEEYKNLASRGTQLVEALKYNSLNSENIHNSDDAAFYNNTVVGIPLRKNPETGEIEFFGGMVEKGGYLYTPGGFVRPDTFFGTASYKSILKQGLKEFKEEIVSDSLNQQGIDLKWQEVEQFTTSFSYNNDSADHKGESEELKKSIIFVDGKPIKDEDTGLPKTTKIAVTSNTIKNIFISYLTDKEQSLLQDFSGGSDFGRKTDKQEWLPLKNVLQDESGNIIYNDGSKEYIIKRVEGRGKDTTESFESGVCLWFIKGALNANNGDLVALVDKISTDGQINYESLIDYAEGRFIFQTGDEQTDEYPDSPMPDAEELALAGEDLANDYMNVDQ